MGRRRRKVVKPLKRKLPKIFLCPKCGEEAVKVNIERKGATAAVACGRCGLKAEITISLQDQPVDVYCKFTDRFYAGKLV